MIFQRPATKSGPLFDQLAQYILSNDVPDATELAALRRAAGDVLRTPDVAEGHILCSGIAVLEWNVENASWHVEQAVQHETSIATLMNSTVTFGALNRPDLGIPYALRAATLAPSNPAVINEASSMLIAVGRVFEAQELQAACVEADPSTQFEIVAGTLIDLMGAAGVTEDWLTEELCIARQVLIDARIRIRHFSYEGEKDPDGSPCLAFEFGFFGDLDDEFRLDDELAARLARTDRWNASRLSVHMQYVEVDEDAFVTA